MRKWRTTGRARRDKLFIVYEPSEGGSEGWRVRDTATARVAGGRDFSPPVVKTGSRGTAMIARPIHRVSRMRHETERYVSRCSLEIDETANYSERMLRKLLFSLSR